MSAFIVSKKTMDRAVMALKLAGNDLAATDPTALGSRLYMLNIEAVGQRYPGESPDTMPGCYTDGQHPDGTQGYKHTAEPFYTKTAALKALDCLIYQCSEGTIPQTELYKEIQDRAGQLARYIVSETKEYDQARWD